MFNTNPPSKLLVIGDVHNKITEVEEIVKSFEKTHRILFVGDYFDDFHDTPYHAINVAKWLKESLQDPNRIHLLGNHDLQYSHWSNTGNHKKIYYCAGYDVNKDAAICRVLEPRDWEKVKLWHQDQGWVFSHAGFHPYWFSHPINGMDHIPKLMEEAKKELEDRMPSKTLWAAGLCRGGSHPAGGLLWCDHLREHSPIENFKQIYGHTPLRNGIDIQIGTEETQSKGGININVDCFLEEVLEIDEKGQYKIIKIE
jgi:hypothetical protein